MALPSRAWFDRLRRGNALKCLAPILVAAAREEATMMAMSDAELAGQAAVFRARRAAGKAEERDLPRILASGREAARRALGLRAFDPQLMAAVVMARGGLAEMATGEGKTLAAILAGYLTAVEGRPVHIALPNPYLANRDNAQASAVLSRLGVTCALNSRGLRPVEKRRAYNCSVVYATMAEFVLDYLRDGLATNEDDRVQGPMGLILADETDLLLIDEARTPIVLSESRRAQSELYQAVAPIIDALASDQVEVDLAIGTASLTESGIDQVEDSLRRTGLLGEDCGLFDVESGTLANHVVQALRARFLKRSGIDYVVAGDAIVLVDALTGRPHPGRRLPDGLHQAIEAREGVTISDETVPLAGISVQNFIRLYPMRAGMTATARDNANEFKQLFGLRVVPIPLQAPSRRIDHPDRHYSDTDKRDAALLSIIRQAHENRRPVLVGTTGIAASEAITAQLRREGIPVEFLDARHTDAEQRVIAAAGSPGSVTVATNMAGRGTDIPLGGPPPADLTDDVARAALATAREEVIAAGGLLIIGTARHDSKRLDAQLRGRAGRQGDPGESLFLLSLDDPMLEGIRRSSPRVLDRLRVEPESGVVKDIWAGRLFDQMQAAREGVHASTRKMLLKFDDILHQQRSLIFQQRAEILQSVDLTPITDAMRSQLVDDLVDRHLPRDSYVELWDIGGLAARLSEDLGLALPLEDWAAEEGVLPEDIADRIEEAGRTADIERAAAFGPIMMQSLRKQALISALDHLWRNHYADMEYLRGVVFLRGYARRDPILEYQSEAFSRFESRLAELRGEVCRSLARTRALAAPQQMNIMSGALGRSGLRPAGPKQG